MKIQNGASLMTWYSGHCIENMLDKGISHIQSYLSFSSISMLSFLTRNSRSDAKTITFYFLLHKDLSAHTTWLRTLEINLYDWFLFASFLYIILRFSTGDRGATHLFLLFINRKTSERHPFAIKVLSCHKWNKVFGNWHNLIKRVLPYCSYK